MRSHEKKVDISRFISKKMNFASWIIYRKIYESGKLMQCYRDIDQNLAIFSKIISCLLLIFLIIKSYNG